MKQDCRTVSTRLAGLCAMPAPKIARTDLDDGRPNLLRRFGWKGHELAVVVQHGERGVLLEPLPYAWVKGDAERIWLGTADHYPHAWIVSGSHGCLVQRFEAEADLRRWMIELERELAA